MLGPRRFPWAMAALPMLRLGSVLVPYMALR